MESKTLFPGWVKIPTKISDGISQSGHLLRVMVDGTKYELFSYSCKRNMVKKVGKHSYPFIETVNRLAVSCCGILMYMRSYPKGKNYDSYPMGDWLPKVEKFAADIGDIPDIDLQRYWNTLPRKFW